MTSPLLSVSFDASDPAGVAAFWAGMLGRQIRRDTRGVLLPGNDTQVGLRFVAADTEKSGDPGGNEFCVIEPGNNFLTGCGILAEVTCNGSRQVGLFWSNALRWPLVWDHGDQTAVQSPGGGTKVSWDVWPVSPQSGRPRQRLDLTVPDLAGEVERLVALGATELGNRDGGVALTDPDGKEFLVTSG